MFSRVKTIVVPVASVLNRLPSQKPSICADQQWKVRGNLHIHLGVPCSDPMDTPMTPEMNLNYEDIVKLTGDNSIILIDVREPRELQENGVLPNSVNIPLSDVTGALQCTSQEEFEKRYGIPFPDKDAPIVFSCHAGGRSLKALLAALEMGYKNAKHYAGGFSDWKKNTENPQ